MSALANAYSRLEDCRSNDQVSILPSQEYPGGHVLGLKFWDGVDEHTEHVNAISVSRDKAKRFARWIVEHDETTAHLGSSQKMKKRQELLRDVFNKMCKRRGLSQTARWAEGEDATHETIHEQLNERTGIYLQRNPEVAKSLAASDAAALQRLKGDVKKHQLHFYRIHAQVLAGAVAVVLQGNRRPVDWSMLPGAINIAASIMSRTISALRKSCSGTVTAIDRFFHFDPLKTSVAAEIEDEICNEHEEILSDEELLRLLKLKAEMLQAKMETPTFPAPSGIPLKESLREEAHQLIEDIVWQANVDLAILDAAKKPGSMHGKRARVDDESKEQVEVDFATLSETSIQPNSLLGKRSRIDAESEEHAGTDEAGSRPSKIPKTTPAKGQANGERRMPAGSTAGSMEVNNLAQGPPAAPLTKKRRREEAEDDEPAVDDTLPPKRKKLIETPGITMVLQEDGSFADETPMLAPPEPESPTALEAPENTYDSMLAPAPLAGLDQWSQYFEGGDMGLRFGEGELTENGWFRIYG